MACTNTITEGASTSDESKTNPEISECNLHAVKIMSKHQIMDAKQVDHVYNEIFLTWQLEHQFIVRKDSHAK